MAGWLVLDCRRWRTGDRLLPEIASKEGCETSECPFDRRRLTTGHRWSRDWSDVSLIDEMHTESTPECCYHEDPWSSLSLGDYRAQPGKVTSSSLEVLGAVATAVAVAASTASCCSLPKIVTRVLMRGSAGGT